MKRMIGMVVACLVSFSPTVARAHRIDVDDEMAAAASESNKNAGAYSLGKVLLGVTYDRRNHMYTLKWQIAGAQDRDIPGLRQRARTTGARLTATLCSGSATRRAIAAGVIIVHSYSTQSGTFVAASGVTEMDCQMMEKAAQNQRGDSVEPEQGRRGPEQGRRGDSGEGVDSLQRFL